MADEPFSGLALAGAITGAELLAMTQSGVSVQSTLAAILAGFLGTTKISQTSDWTANTTDLGGGRRQLQAGANYSIVGSVARSFTLVINGTNKIFEKREFDYNEKIAWRDGTLYFKNSDFNEIVHRLENWYGVNITINKSIDRKKDFTGHFTNEDLDLILNGLSFTYDFDFKINGKEVIIK